jgi:hypothetical protein
MEAVSDSKVYALRAARHPQPLLVVARLDPSGYTATDSFMIAIDGRTTFTPFDGPMNSSRDRYQKDMNRTTCVAFDAASILIISKPQQSAKTFYAAIRSLQSMRARSFANGVIRSTALLDETEDVDA